MEEVFKKKNRINSDTLSCFFITEDNYLIEKEKIGFPTDFIIFYNNKLLPNINIDNFDNITVMRCNRIFNKEEIIKYCIETFREQFNYLFFNTSDNKNLSNDYLYKLRYSFNDKTAIIGSESSLREGVYHKYYPNPHIYLDFFLLDLTKTYKLIFNDINNKFDALHFEHGVFSITRQLRNLKYEVYVIDSKGNRIGIELWDKYNYRKLCENNNRYNVNKNRIDLVDIWNDLPEYLINKVNISEVFDENYFYEKYGINNGLSYFLTNGIKTNMFPCDNWQNIILKMNGRIFDWKLYISLYPDLIENNVLTKDKANEHYIFSGIEEGRATCYQDFYSDASFAKIKKYKLKTDPLVALENLDIYKDDMRVFFCLFCSIKEEEKESIVTRNNYNINLYKNNNIITVIHCGNIDVLLTMNDYLNIVKIISKYIIITIIDKNFINKITSIIPNAIIITVENKGTDNYPFLKSIEYILKEDLICDILIKLHTKSDKIKREEILDDLLINIDEKISLLNNEIGMICPDNHLGNVVEVNNISNLLNYYYLDELLSIFNTKVAAEDKFSMGTFFIAKFEIFEKFFTLQRLPKLYDLFHTGYYREEATHYFERIYGILTRASGFRVTSMKKEIENKRVIPSKNRMVINDEFDENFYRLNNLDLKYLNINLFEHFLKHGSKEKRPCKYNEKIAYKLEHKIQDIDIKTKIESFETLFEIPRIIKVNRERIIWATFPSLESALIFGGYSGYINYIKHVKKTNNVGIITLESRHRVDVRTSYTRNELLSKDTIILCKDDLYWEIGEDDIFMSYRCLDILFLDKIRQEYTKHQNIVAFISEFEPCFFPNDTEKYLHLEAYYRNIIVVFTSRYLKNYFEVKKIGNIKESYSFETPLIDIEPNRNFILNANRKKRLIFYARPEHYNKRNAFELGILGLKRASEKGILDNVEIIGFGSSDTIIQNVKLNNGNYLVLLPSLTKDEYRELLSTSDIGMNLMLAPHPGIVCFEMVNAGIITIVNKFEDVRDENFFNNEKFVVVEPMIESIAEGIEKAIILSSNTDLRLNGDNWECFTYDNAFSEIPDIFNREIV